jgi:spore germination cell wall hydrolase CwlJ-like protein
MSKLRKVANTVIGLMFLSGGVAAAGTDNGNSKATQAFDAIEFIAESIQPNSVDPKELLCLARNIFYESGGEPEAGKIAVGVVTLNRVEDPRFPKTVCEVVKQKTVIKKSREVVHTDVVKVGYFGKTEERTKTYTVTDKKVVCQFSWVCAVTKRINKDNDDRWTESLDVAQRLLEGEHDTHKEKLGNILYFHATYVNPMWVGLKRTIKIGGHIFYVEKKRNK